MPRSRSKSKVRIGSLKKGGLKGYKLSQSAVVRRKHLSTAVNSRGGGYATIMRRLNALYVFNKNKYPSKAKNIQSDKVWLRTNYGGGVYRSRRKSANKRKGRVQAAKRRKSPTKRKRKRKSPTKRKRKRKSPTKRKRKSPTKRRRKKRTIVRCSKSSGAKYVRRPGPPYPANNCKWQKRAGNNGDLYQSKPVSGGSYFRWVKIRR